MSSTLSNTTGEIEIQHPELWTLHLGLGTDKIEFVIYTKAQADSLISGSIAMDMSFGDYLKSLENCVYDNPVLLKPFSKVSVVADSQHFLFLPKSVGDDEELAAAVFEKSFPDIEGEMSLCQMPQCGVVSAFELPKGVKAFLQRTFFNPPVCHSLVPLCEYYSSKQESTSLSRMFLYVGSDEMKMCVFGKGKLLMSNVYKCQSIDDAAFYALHAWQSYSLDALNDEMQLAGDKRVRDELVPILRKYINYVMPTIFPAAAMRIGHDAVKAPYQLILHALCE